MLRKTKMWNIHWRKVNEKRIGMTDISIIMNKLLFQRGKQTKDIKYLASKIISAYEEDTTRTRILYFP